MICSALTKAKVLKFGFLGIHIVTGAKFIDTESTAYDNKIVSNKISF